MSIVPLVKATVCGPLAEKPRALAELQELGCLHLLPLNKDAPQASGGGPAPQTRDALRFLLTARPRRHQSLDASRFDARTVEARALALQRRMQTLEDERDFLQRRIRDLWPWGEFAYPPPEQFPALRLWFYMVPHYLLKELREHEPIWQVVRRDNRFEYVVVLAAEEPQGMPVPRTHTGSLSLSTLRNRLEAVEVRLEDLQAARLALTRWCTLFRQSVHHLEDEAALAEATQHTLDSEPLFALQGWAPEDSGPNLRDYAARRGLALQLQPPQPGEQPPTLMRNRPTLGGGQALVSFYMTPGYWVWDPSVIVFFSFAVFFAMILSDAGYALVLALGLALGWRWMGRGPVGRQLRPLFATLVGAAALWGVLVGSYFGTSPPAGSLLGRFNVLQLTDSGTMMRLSIAIGVTHVILANLVEAWSRRHSLAALAPAGWVAIMLGGAALWLGTQELDDATLRLAGGWALGLGAVAVLLFSGSEGPLWRRLLSGLLALTRITSAFGDVLSYLRLFALGLASASLALAFNDLAGQVATAPAFGKLAAALILLVGHSLNFALGIVSGFVHGLRLNFIEFFNWSVPEEGYPFRAFAKRERPIWRR
ncbi:MAG TPA: V-type ATP synthase subunit I [bacterium]|nr:V-type ATP synthase subunit I [bacterium]